MDVSVLVRIAPSVRYRVLAAPIFGVYGQVCVLGRTRKPGIRQRVVSCKLCPMRSSYLCRQGPANARSPDVVGCSGVGRA